MKFRDVCFPALVVVSLFPVLLWLTVTSQVKFKAPEFKNYLPYTGSVRLERHSRSSDTSSTVVETSEATSKIKVFCWILTMEKDINTKIPAVNGTWARRCDGKIYIMTAKNPITNNEIIDLKVPDGREHLTEKTIAALQYVYDHYLDDYDWFLKSDDDTYIIMENLRYLLSHYNPNEPVYLGHLFKKFSRTGYMSGGAGYLLSRKALKLLVELGYRKGTTCPKSGSDEDVDLGGCLQRVGVQAHNTLDRFGRETFHPFSATQHLSGDLPSGLGNWDRNPTKKGEECCSELSISYHYINPKQMMTIEFLLYKTSVYGRVRNPSVFKRFFQVGIVPPLNEVPP